MIPLLAITRDDRKRDLLATMALAKLDWLVIGSSGLNHIDQSNPVAHITGFRCIGPGLLILEAGGRTSLIVSPAQDAERLPAFGIDGVATDDPAAWLTKMLPEPRGAIGLVGFRALPRRLVSALAPHLAGGENFDETFIRATARKLDCEIDAARRAAGIAEKGLEFLLQSAAPGRRECDLAVEVNMAMKSLGADDCFLMLNCGPRADAVNPSSQRKIETGDLILCELSPSVEGQYTQICRTISVGEPAPVITEKYNLLVAAMHEGIACVKPGAPIGAVCGAIDDHLSAAGYAQYSRPPFIRRRGHGLGGGSSFPGHVAVDNSTILEPGMFFVVHPNQFLPETGYMMCGEPVLVTPDGVEILSRQHARLLSVAGGAA